jgi:hypothetical protein
MPEQSHSPEPWSVGTTDEGGERYTTLFSGGDPIAVSRSAGYGGETVIDISDEDLRRIVACVNACRGIPTEVLCDIALLDNLANVDALTRAVQWFKENGTA